MKKSNKESRRDFIKKSAVAGSLMTTPFAAFAGGKAAAGEPPEGRSMRYLKSEHAFNGAYNGEHLERLAFPIGGIGAGMFCLEGSGSMAQMSIFNTPDIMNEPCAFSALHLKGIEKGSKVLEGPVPEWKKMGLPGANGSSARGAGRNSYGLPRFTDALFRARFPYGLIELEDEDIPLGIQIRGWSPFIPTREDDSSLPVGAFEYSFTNHSASRQEGIFSWNAKHFIAADRQNLIRPTGGGFILEQPTEDPGSAKRASFACFVPGEEVLVDCKWFKGQWFDPLSMAWNKIESGDLSENREEEVDSPGASLFVPFTLEPAASKTIRLLFCWYVPNSSVRAGGRVDDPGCRPGDSCAEGDTYRPWYVRHFASVDEIASHFEKEYDRLDRESGLFTDAFYRSDLPDEVMEAIAANLSILKSPTVLRQTDGRLWAFEGCNDSSGCCSGSCTHVWNYAQAIPHLFPRLERSLRETEFTRSQDDRGHQTFRSALPIQKTTHNRHAASDGQLGGLMKLYRDWRISGDTRWMKTLYPEAKKSLDYCIRTWDPLGKGILEEPHHNTYDIEFWGPDGMCTSFYLGALSAFIEMSKALDEPHERYAGLLEKGVKYMEEELFDGEYFIHKIQWTGLQAEDPVAYYENNPSIHSDYSEDAVALLKKEGPKYQYGRGCLSDGILGMWIASCAGLREPVDNKKVTSHLLSIHRYNLKRDLSDHVNPQRPTYAMGNEGGLILCSWPKGGRLSLPFVYSNEVWTGIEYQVASHLMMKGEVEKGLEIVRYCRSRYDGRVRNPFDEFECGHYYARALASYGMLQGLTGIRYDALEKTLYIDSRIGNDFTSFLSTETAFGNVGLKDGKPFVDMKIGNLDVERLMVSGKKVNFSMS